MAIQTDVESGLLDFKKELQHNCYSSRGPNGELECFLPEADLLKFWTTKRLGQFFERIRLDVGGQRNFSKLLYDGSKLLSILIWIEYPEWEHFRDLYFADDKSLSLLWDNDLPCRDLHQNIGARKLFATKLGPQSLEKFQIFQYVFTPICFKEGEQIFEKMKRIVPILQVDESISGVAPPGTLTADEVAEEMRKIAPFAEMDHSTGGEKVSSIFRSEQIAETTRSIVSVLKEDISINAIGASGTVTTAYIPESCLKTKDNHSRFLGNWYQDQIRSFPWAGHSKLHKVACKRIRLTEASREMGDRELENLKLLSSRHIYHMNLAQSIAAISIEETKQIVLLFELAVCNLDDYLVGPSQTPFGGWTLADLLDQMYWIGDALLFLHESLCRHLGGGQERKAFCHLDIKPANILMYKSENSARDGELVGTWKLADFGISGENELKQVVKRGGTTWSVSDSLAFTGTFCAPEIFDKMEAGRAADIWSLGCVLFLVTMRGHNSIELILMYGEDGLMGKSTDGISDAQDDCFYRKESNTEPLSGNLNPHVRHWLDDYESTDRDRPSGPLFGLIKQMLTVDPDKRITTDDFLQRFRSIIMTVREATPQKHETNKQVVMDDLPAHLRSIQNNLEKRIVNGSTLGSTLGS